MVLNSSQPIAIFIFSDFAFNYADKIARSFDNATIFATKRVTNPACKSVESIGEEMLSAFRSGQPIIAFCSTGIVIRILAKALEDKFSEPPVICVAENGSVVVPLLGSNAGANDLAYKIASNIQADAAITTSSPLRFGINLLTPPSDLELVNKNDAAAFISALLSGEKVSMHGNHDWFTSSALPFDVKGTLKIHVGTSEKTGNSKTLIYRPLHRPQGGSLSIIGLGPGDKKYLTYSARTALENATDILGYDYYIKLAAPFASHQIVHPSDNREELARSRKALDLAIAGKKVAIISSGDPGIFAMAAAVMECMEMAPEGSMDNITVSIEPGITAAQSAAAKLGAPLGHDFAVISLSDNLKSWDIIKKRLIASIESDMALALYNPVSRARPHQIREVFKLLNDYCKPDTIIMVGTDIGRSGEKTTTSTLLDIDLTTITSRSVILVGSSQTKSFSQGDRLWTYTPRSYPKSG